MVLYIGRLGRIHSKIWTGVCPAPDGGTVMTAWTPERVATVTRLWNEGLTTAEIGRAVGMSKNAVVGKAHRLQLPPRPSPIRRGKSYTRTPKAKNGERRRMVERAEVGCGAGRDSGCRRSRGRRSRLSPSATRPASGPSATRTSPTSTSAASMRCSASPTARSTIGGPTWPSGRAPTQPDVVLIRPRLSRALPPA